MSLAGPVQYERSVGGLVFVPVAAPVNPFKRVRWSEILANALEPLTYLNNFDGVGLISFLLDGIPTRDVTMEKEMNPEEAASKLREFLDTQAEAFRRPPRVYIVKTDIFANRDHRVYVQIFGVDEEGKLEGLDYWLVRAAETPRGTRTRILSGQYTPEVGFRLDGLHESVRAEVRHIFEDALNDIEYVRSIEIEMAA